MSQQINLYSPLFRKQKKVFSALAMLQAMALVIVVVAASYVFISMRTSLLEIQAADSSQRLKSELERLKVYGAGESPAERDKALAARKRSLEAGLAERGRAMQALQEGALGRAQGYSDPLRALARSAMGGVWLTRIEFSEHNGELSLVGRATRAELVARYLERLRAEQALRGQGFSSLEIRRQAVAKSAPFVEFALSSEDREAGGK